jgi:hypothetical protein
MAFINDRLGLATFPITNIAANGAIGTAAATVDIASQFNITQTTPNIVLTLPNPTNVLSGYMARVNNTGSASFTMYGVVIYPDQFADFTWDGNSWNKEAGGGTTKIYRNVQNLSAGANVITHNLALFTPFATIVQARDNATGEEIPLRVMLEATNTLTINVPVAYTATRITVIG